MQLKDQWKGPKNWKLITGVATAATLGFGAIAVAAPGSNDLPQTIDLSDRVAVTDDSFVPSTGSFVAFDISADDSVLASAQVSADVSADETLDSSAQDASVQDASIDADDSLDASPQASIDDSADDSASTDSLDSADDSD